MSVIYGYSKPNSPVYSTHNVPQKLSQYGIYFMQYF